MEPISNYITQIQQALSDEVKGRSIFPKKSSLTNGIRTAVSDESAVYRFEIPENFLLDLSLTIQCTLGTKLQFSFPAVIVEVYHQFVFLLVPFDMGEIISELVCEWNPSEAVERLSECCGRIRQKEIVTRLVTRDFSDNARPAFKEPIFPSTFTESQRAAVRKSMTRKISIIVGERKRGKTGVASSLLLNVLREGKRVLYLTPSSGGLHDCMEELVSLNPVVAAESVAVIDSGICLLSPLPMPLYGMEGSGGGVHREGLKKLAKIIAAEHEYERVDALSKKREEKHRQIEETSAEVEEIKTELQRLQNASMLERMKQGINKTNVESTHVQLQDKLALVERLKQHASALLKEEYKRETQLPVSLKEKKELDKLVSTQVLLEPSFPSTITAVRCIAMTVHQALKVEPTKLGEFDVVCIDDAHALNLAEFFWCASQAQEQCFILADITEQPPQSVSQLGSARKWLQKNYFTFYQQGESDEHRFTTGSLPENTASELTNPDLPPSLFESCLASALYQTPVPPGAKGKIFFINTEDQRAVSAQYLGKKKILPFNEASAKRVVECVKHALVNGTTAQSDILIVTPPSGQTMYLREVLKAYQMSEIEIASLGSVRLCTKRTVIFDTTVAGLDFTLRSLDDKKSGAVRVADTFNTLLSTVREDLYVIADLSHFNTWYKDRFVVRLLGIFKSRSENVGNIPNGARRFDELSPEVRKAVLFATAEEKQSSDYKTKLERAKLSVADAAKSGAQQSIALTDRKLRNDIRSVILRVLAKREVINVVAQYLEGFPLYKTTLETVRYSSILPELDCENENDFKSVMDMWNVLIYETSSAQKIDHPLASKAKVDAKISSDLQDIYTYYHSDLEVVVEVGKHKLAQSIQKIFNDCIGKKPVTPTDWMNAYFVFLGRMEKYLDTVNGQVRM
ncbi:MAG: hypothetical protein WBZ48_03205 [Bacteroidota bacterium]